MTKLFFAVLFLFVAAAQADTTATTNPATTTSTTTATNCKDESHYPLVSKDELKTISQNKEAVIFDVNGKDSFKKAHVPGAIDYVTNEKKFDTYLPKDKNAEIVAYCGSTMCSAWKKAAERACNMGYTNVKHFKEGIKGWTATN